jgi:hypothetical protein
MGKDQYAKKARDDAILIASKRGRSLWNANTAAFGNLIY